MGHPDEGTIHAWLDGELAPDESRTIEAHVASCDTCANAVAEARGFIAASSRVLSALDNVPGDVIPQPARTAARVDDLRQVQAQRQRRVRQGIGIAATLLFMLTGGMYVINQAGTDFPSSADTAALGERIAAAVEQDSSVVADSAVGAGVAVADNAGDAAATTGLSAPVASAPLREGEQQRTTRELAARNEAKTSVPVAGRVAAGTPATAGRIGTGDGAQADVVATVVTAPPPVPVPPPSKASATVAAGESRAAAARTGADMGTVAQSRRFVADSAGTRDTSVVANALRQRQVAGATPQAAPAVSTAPSLAARRFAGCYMLVSTANLSVADSRGDGAALVAALPSRLHLTDTLLGSSGTTPRFLARSVIPGGTPVRRFAWTPSVNGTVELFVGDSIGAPSIRATADSLPQGSLPARLERIDCR